MIVVGEKGMSKKKGRPKSSRDDTTVKVDRILIGKAQLIAKHRGISVAELISEMIRSPIEKAYGQLLHLYDEKDEK